MGLYDSEPRLPGCLACFSVRSLPRGHLGNLTLAASYNKCTYLECLLCSLLLRSLSLAFGGRCLFVPAQTVLGASQALCKLCINL